MYHTCLTLRCLAIARLTASAFQLFISSHLLSRLTASASCFFIAIARLFRTPPSHASSSSPSHASASHRAPPTSETESHA
ncbi:hypothetical protein ACOSQ3_022574 [Xanthoceras sorbifolium]